MTTPIDRHAAHVAHEVLGRGRQVLTGLASDLERAHASFKELLEGSYSRDEYIQHLERRLAELRADPPAATVLGVLAALEPLGVRVLGVLANQAGNIHTVRVYWPGDEHPHEHRLPDEGGQAAFAAELRSYAASLSKGEGEEVGS